MEAVYLTVLFDGAHYLQLKLVMLESMRRSLDWPSDLGLYPAASAEFELAEGKR